jgi:hypothetical protein
MLRHNFLIESEHTNNRRPENHRCVERIQGSCRRRSECRATPTQTPGTTLTQLPQQRGPRACRSGYEPAPAAQPLSATSWGDGHLKWQAIHVSSQYQSFSHLNFWNSRLTTAVHRCDAHTPLPSTRTWLSRPSSWSHARKRDCTHCREWRIFSVYVRVLLPQPLLTSKLD